MADPAEFAVHRHADGTLEDFIVDLPPYFATWKLAGYRRAGVCLGGPDDNFLFLISKNGKAGVPYVFIETEDTIDKKLDPRAAALRALKDQAGIILTVDQLTTSVRTEVSPTFGVADIFFIVKLDNRVDVNFGTSDLHSGYRWDKVTRTPNTGEWILAAYKHQVSNEDVRYISKNVMFLEEKKFLC